jgi:hypothetical protein
MINEYGAVGGARIVRGDRSTRRKYAPVPLCPPQISYGLGSNPRHRDEKLATNHLSYGSARVLLNLPYRNNAIPSQCYRKRLPVTKDFLFTQNNKIRAVFKVPL